MASKSVVKRLAAQKAGEPNEQDRKTAAEIMDDVRLFYLEPSERAFLIDKIIAALEERREAAITERRSFITDRELRDIEEEYARLRRRQAGTDAEGVQGKRGIQNCYEFLAAYIPVLVKAIRGEG